MNRSVVVVVMEERVSGRHDISACAWALAADDWGRCNVLAVRRGEW